jgi:hypothetical protein
MPLETTGYWKVEYTCPVCREENEISSDDNSEWDVIDQEKPWMIETECSSCEKMITVNLISALMD